MGKKRKALDAMDIEESWETARGFVEPIGKMPSLFTSSIRALRVSSPDEDDKEVGVKNCHFLISSSPTLKAVFYHAAIVHHPTALNDCAALNTKNLIRLFHPVEAASILALAYLSRCIKKHCQGPEWRFIAAPLKTHVDVGAAVGSTIRHIGSGYGLLLGGIRHLAMGLFSITDPKGFKSFRRSLASRGLLFDLEEENERWGCNHLQLASCLVQNMGFGINASKGLGIESLSLSESIYDENDDEVICWRAALFLTESFHRTGGPPEGLSEDDILYLPPDETSKLKKRIAQLQKEDSKEGWLLKTKADLTPDILQKLDISGVKIENGTEEDLENLETTLKEEKLPA